MLAPVVGWVKPRRGRDALVDVVPARSEASPDSKRATVERIAGVGEARRGLLGQIGGLAPQQSSSLRVEHRQAS